MYIQITNKCNMHCDHCGHNSTPNGRHMDIKVFKTALELAHYYDDNITLGGGEPTLHPQFWEILGLTIGKSQMYQDMPSGLVTNGTQTEIMWTLFALAKKEIIWLGVSLDGYHDDIVHPRVKEHAEKNKFVRRASPDRIYNIGRAKKNKIGTRRDSECICLGPIVDITGNLWACGHRRISWGTIYKPRIPTDFGLDVNMSEFCSEGGEV